MQYTGLRDKNGKDIYEGDIVEYVKNGVYNKGYVVFDYGAFMIKDDSNALIGIIPHENLAKIEAERENRHIIAHLKADKALQNAINEPKAIPYWDMKKQVVAIRNLRQT